MDKRILFQKVSMLEMGKRRQKIALAVSKPGHYLDIGLGQLGPGVQGCSKLMAAYLGIHKMAVFSAYGLFIQEHLWSCSHLLHSQ